MQIRTAREADANAIARVHVDSWRTTYAGIVPDSYLASLSHEKQAHFWGRALVDAKRQNFIYVAETPSDNQVVGFACGGPEREGHPQYSGELYAIYLLAAFQRQGLGRALVAVVANELLARGMNSMLIWVLEANPATGFYEALGGVRVAHKTVSLGGASLTEVAYGWRELGRLASLLGSSGLSHRV